MQHAVEASLAKSELLALTGRAFAQLEGINTSSKIIHLLRGGSRRTEEDVVIMTGGRFAFILDDDATGSGIIQFGRAFRLDRILNMHTSL
jgi:hypothetical protein